MLTTTPRSLAAAVVATVALSLTSCSTTAGSDSTGATDDAGIRTTDSSHLLGNAVPGHCRGRIGDISVGGDVTVPRDATCELDGTRVEGNVSVGHGAHLIARGVDVDGDLEGEGTASVEVTDDSSIGGNLQIEQGGSAIVRGSHVDGDLSWEEQDGALVAQGNTVRGNLEADRNSGGVTLTDNDVDGDLSCEENGPAPEGRGNHVSGNAEDQCRGL
jgi:hypothetical protein